MSQTHTPGTWADAGMHDVASDLLCYPVRWVKDGNGDLVCLVPVDDESDANAERIVLCCNAHDDLVAALNEILAMIPWKDWTDEDSAHYPWIEQARAALAKAGEK